MARTAWPTAPRFCERPRDLGDAVRRVERPAPLRLSARGAARHRGRVGRLDSPLGHLPRAQLCTRDDRHACKVELGVDGRGENRGGPHARGAEQRHEQIDEAALAAQRVEQRHRGPGAARRILVPSATPYAPFVTTTSPAWSPDVISATVSLRPPTVTGRTWATCSASTTKT